MSPQDRPKGEFMRPQAEGASIHPQGRPKGEFMRPQAEGASVHPQGRPKGESEGLRPEASQ